MNSRSASAILGAAALLAAGAAPALASIDGAKKPLKGTWSFTDATADPTPSAMVGAGPVPARDGFCVGTVPSAPTDTNTQTIKLTGAGMLSVAGHTTGDWAMEIRDAKGKFLTGSDGGTPQTQEGAVLTVRKKATLTVVFCNLGGAPTATADYTFTPR